MKSKKDIFQWWCGVGGTTKAHQDFLNTITIPYEKEIKEKAGHTYFIYKMFPPRCKYSLSLAFDSYGICYHITGY